MKEAANRPRRWHLAGSIWLGAAMWTGCALASVWYAGAHDAQSMVLWAVCALFSLKFLQQELEFANHMAGKDRFWPKLFAKWGALAADNERLQRENAALRERLK